MMDKLMKAYVIKEAVEFAAKDATKFMKKQLRNWDSDQMLRKVGLTTYKPAKATMGTASMFLFGAAVGGLAALLLAPKTGTELRTDVMNKLNTRREDMKAPTSVRLETAPTARV